MKKLIPLLLVCVLLLSGCKPDGIDDQTYELGKRAIEVAQDYLNAKTTTNEAIEQMKMVYERLDGFDFDKDTQHTKYHHNTMVKTHVLGLEIGINMSNTGDVSDELKELKKYLGVK